MKKTVSNYILVCSAFAILIMLTFTLYSIHEYEANEFDALHEKLESSIKTFRLLLEHKGADFRIVDGTLLAGTYQINGNFEVPDKVQEIFGVVATVFMGDTRVSTNVLDASGKRALGTRLVGPAYDAVFRAGTGYRGEAPILGVNYLTAYDPIRDRTGTVIGVLFVGVKVSDFIAPLHVMQLRLVLTLLGMVAVFAIVMVFLGRAMKGVEVEKENQLRFQQTLIDTIPNPVFYKDADCRYLGCNKAFEAYTGYSRNELIGRTPHDVWESELADTYRFQDQVLLEHPGMSSYEATVRYADGSRREVVFNKATFEGNDGVVAGLVGVILDITERKLAEEQTKNAYQQLFDIIEFLPDATFVVDMDKRVMFWNRAIEKMTGIAKSEIIGRGDFAYAVPFYGAQQPILIDFLDEDQDTLDKYTFIKRDGHTLFAETSLALPYANGDRRILWGTASPLFDQQGKRVGAIESIRDITAYKIAEDERSLLLSQLHHARMMETFMIRLGHDLRTPLTPLFMLFPLIRGQLDNPEQQRMIDICGRSVSAIKKLVDRAQLLVKLSAEVQREELVPVPLADFVGELMVDCADSMSQKRVTGRRDIDPRIVVQAIPDQLRELFANLIANAVRFSSEQGTIRVTAEQRAGKVLVAVHDDGIGLAPDFLERIFDEFFKADESRHDLTATGLGLSICKRIVFNHHGRIWAESPGIGKGTTIRFTLDEQSADHCDAKEP